jgi:protein-S-isoprenylcysteine O-methyltransferase Ste14
MNLDVGLFSLLVLNFFITGILPKIFFRADGKFNLKWCLTAAPFGIQPAFVALGYFGVWEPLVSIQDPSWAKAQICAAVTLSCLSIFLIGFTMGTNRVPLALWHQENDAPKNIVTWGPYQWVRHPFYSSFILSFLAAVIAFPSISTIGVLIYSIVTLTLTAKREEGRLSRSQFGEEYKAYMKKTGRFFPSFS